MPTYENPAADASEAAEALRGLAHASRTFSDPSDTYRVLASLSGALMSLRQSLDQLADWHERNADHAATDDDDRATGRRDATAASDYLHHAAERVEHANRSLNEAFNYNGRIAWQRPDIDRGSAGPTARPTANHVKTGQARLAPPSAFSTGPVTRSGTNPLGR